MPIIEVTLIEGRDPEKKEELISALTDAVERSIGAPRDTIRVILREIPPAHYAAGGVSFARKQARLEPGLPARKGNS